MRGISLVAMLTALALASPGWAEESDLREFRIGMAVGDLPRSGYKNLSCADDAARKLETWRDYMQCPETPSGLRAVRFRYDEAANPLSKVNDLYEGTKVGGHPVLLTLLIGEGRVDGLVIETDPAARLYFRKKAFLFGDQAKARYGSDGWTCIEGQPAGGEEPVGGAFLKERCTKQTPSRRIALDRELFRKAGQDLKNFVSRSRLEVRGPG